MTETKKSSAWMDNPGYHIDIEQSENRIQVVFNKTVIADSDSALVLQESDYTPLYYFPVQDVRLDLMQPITKITFCPYKGDARHYSLQVGDKHVEVAAWDYETPFPEVAQIKDFISFYPAAIEDLKIL